jgi:hypothetical protein
MMKSKSNFIRGEGLIPCLLLGLVFVACDNGTTSAGSVKSITITGLTDAQKATLADSCNIYICPVNSTNLIDVKAYYQPGHTPAFAGSTDNWSIGGTLEYDLYSSSLDYGTYDVWLYGYNGPAYTYKAVNVSLNNAAPEIPMSLFTLQP